mgnify:CR=1 FL=1
MTSPSSKLLPWVCAFFVSTTRRGTPGSVTPNRSASLRLLFRIDHPVRSGCGSARRSGFKRSSSPLRPRSPAATNAASSTGLSRWLKHGEGFVPQRADLLFGHIPRAREARRQDVEHDDERCGRRRLRSTACARWRASPCGDRAQHAAQVGRERGENGDASSGDVNRRPEVESPGEREREKAEQEERPCLRSRRSSGRPSSLTSTAVRRWRFVR